MSFLLIGTDRTLEESVQQHVDRTTKEARQNAERHNISGALLPLCKIM